MSSLNIADVFIILIIVLSTLIGLYRGFIRELLTLATWIIAGFIAYMFGKTVGDYFVFVDSAAVKEILGMATVFVVIALIGYALKLAIMKAGKFAGVTPIDRILGAVFGVLRGCLLIILVILASSNNLSDQDWYKKSQFMPKFTVAADMVSNATPKTWKDDIKKEMKDVMELEQSAAPVYKATPTSTPGTITTAPTTTTTVTTPAPAAAPSTTPAATTTTTTTAPAVTPAPAAPAPAAATPVTPAAKPAVPTTTTTTTNKSN